MHDDVDKETPLPNARPCPFCGGTSIWTYPGSTFRWRYAGCGECGATCGEVRMNTISIPRPEAIARANDELIAEWNKRTPPEGERTDWPCCLTDGCPHHASTPQPHTPK